MDGLRLGTFVDESRQLRLQRGEDDLRIPVQRGARARAQLRGMRSSWSRQEAVAVCLGVLEDRVGARVVREREGTGTAELCRGDRDLGPGGLFARRVPVEADVTDRAQHGQRELVSDDFVLCDVIEQERGPTCGDEAGSWKSRDGDLAVAAFHLEPTLDHRELTLGMRALGRLEQWHVHAHSLVVAGVVELEPNPDERLAGPLLEARPGLDVPVVPDVRAVQQIDPAQWPVFDALDSLLGRDVHENVVGGRGGVVAVADVLPADDAGEGRQVHVGTCARDCPWHTYGTDTGSAEWWRGNGRD